MGKVTEFVRGIGLAVLVLVLLNLWWRWASRRQMLPCPSWLAFGLESPLLHRILGTDTTLKRLGVRPGERVLEIGPGPGRLLIPIANQVLPGGEAVGLDIQPGMLTRLRTRAVEAGITNLTAVEGDAASLHFPTESFDLVYFVTVLGEIPKREAALRACYTLLKPGGRLSVTELFPDPHYQTRSTVQRLAEEAGFQFASLQGRWYFFTATFVKGKGEAR